MLDTFKKMFKKKNKKDVEETEISSKSKEAAKERLHLVLMQDRANVSVDFLDMMKQEIIEVIKKYIDVDEAEMEVKLTNQIKEDGTNGAPALYANIPIISIKNEYTVKKVAGMKISEVSNLKKQNDEKLLSKKDEVTVNEDAKKDNKTNKKEEKNELKDDKKSKKGKDIKTKEEKNQIVQTIVKQQVNQVVIKVKKL